MPAVGILKKPPHPDPPPLVDRVKPPRPPKPKRGIPPPPPPPRATEVKRSQDVHFADEDEPTTEESYDYKDIDFASEIFDWRIPPPRPKPPRLQANGVAHRVADGVPVVVSEQPALAYDTRPGAMETRLEPVAEEDAKANAATEAVELEVRADKLAIFLAEHEGQELTMEDVRQLELLLDEAEGVEREPGETHVNGELEEAYDEEGQQHEADVRDVRDVRDDAGGQEGEGLDEESNGAMQKCNGEDANHDGAPRVRFSDENEQDLDSGGVCGEIPDEETEDGRPARHADYGIMHFFHAGSKKSAQCKKAKDSGMYEPVGRQDLRFVRPDMSGYKPPEPSDVGDPFSWRRREKHHQYLYGYETRDGDEGHVPAMDKILDGCQEVEEMIKARDLTPPGMLFDSLGRKKRVRKVRPPSPPPRPPPPVPPKLRIPSPLPPIPTEDDVMTEDDAERLSEVEKQILTDSSFVEALVGSVSVKEDLLVAGSLGDGTGERTAEAEVEDLIVPMDATPCQTGGTVETASAALLDSDASPPLETRASDGTEDPETAVDVDMAPQVAPKRVSRRDTRRRYVLARPIPPERRKRVASAEPPLTTFEREREDLLERTPPSKAKRSVSFHTAEEIRRRIDVQAQSYLRTPRRKDRISCVYLAASPSASAALAYGSLRRDHRRPLTPVYSHVNKEAPRRKETAVQTNGGDEDAEATPPAPPPKLRDVEAASLEDPPREPGDAEVHVLEQAPGAGQAVEAAADDSVVPQDFLALSQGKVTEEATRPTVEDSVVPQDFLALSTPQGKVTEEATRPTVEDSVVPQDFLALSTPQGKVTEEATGPTVEDSVVPQDFLALSTPKPDREPEKAADPDVQLAAANTGRPLPPPPAPPRHRGAKAKPFALDGPVVICGLVPQGQEGKMGVLANLKVLRLSVVQLDASMIRVGQIQAEHVVARRLDAQDGSRTPTPTSQRPPDADPAGVPRPGSDDLPNHEGEAADGAVVPGNGNNNVVEAEIAMHTLQAPLYEPSHIRVASPVEGFNVWDDEYVQDRVLCASPTNTLTSTTSGSASYVTCDETLHEDSDVAAEDDFGFGLDEDDEDIDGRGTGCSTPTEMEAPRSSDIPLAALLADSGLSPIFAPPTDPFLASPALAPQLHAHLPMDTDADENFNSFGGDDSRDPSNTVGI